ncbi:hypothetical protein [Microbacterium sp.]|uniref:hypothetical protein n=1 Tax=Microbacterium sp. TaxID=51671 RepID=UPI0039E68D99
MEIRLTHPTDLPFAADVLADAFRDYAWTRHVIPDEAYEHRLRSLQLLYLQYAHEHGLVAVVEGDDDAIDGVIALVAPERRIPRPTRRDAWSSSMATASTDSPTPPSSMLRRGA